jgi:multiple sugar transport system substrate-binding protein
MPASRRLLPLLVAVMTLAMSACRKQVDDPNVVSIATFGSVEHIAKMNAKLAQLTKETGIKTKAIFIPYGNYADKIVLQLADGKAPDVIWSEVSTYVPLQAKGAFKPLDEFIRRDKVDIKIYYSGVMKRFTTGGKVYALPQDTAPIACLFYNKALFKKAGVPFPNDHWTWDDLLKAAQAITSPGDPSPSKVWGFKDNYGPDWANWVYANGGTMTDDWLKPTRCTLDSPAAIEAVTFMRDLMLKHKVMPDEASRQSLGGVGEDLFMQGQLGMFRCGYWPTTKLRTQKGLDWDMAPFPKGPRAKGFSWGTGGSGWAMSRDARDPEKAWAVIKFLGSEPVQQTWVESGDIQPSIIHLAHSPAFNGSVPPANKGFLLTAPDHALYAPTHPSWDSALISTISPRMDLIVAGKKDVVEGMKEITAAVNKELFDK